MGTITLPNFRTTADVTMNTRLKDGGVYIDWTALTDIKAWLYSDAQKAIAGRCTLITNESQPNILVCEYSATKPQYLGVQRLIIQAKYMGRTKTYDKPVFNFVPRTADQEGTQIVIDDPVVNVIHTYRYATALREHGIPHEVHVFPKGSHGLGLATGNPSVGQWGPLLLRWFDSMGWTPGKDA